MLDVYAVFDKKLGEYGPNLQCEKNANMMLRNLSDVLKRAPQLPLAVHATDFEVMCIGKFDEVTGRFDALVPPVHVANLSSLVEQDGRPPIAGIGVVREA